ncbi:MAG: prepilin-type N-terminal cleavage/methylation domain-containing protein [Bacilli bacterium]
MKNISGIIKKGFTLVELVVVIAIIAVLAAVSVGGYFVYIEQAKGAELYAFKGNFINKVKTLTNSRKFGSVELCFNVEDGLVAIDEPKRNETNIYEAMATFISEDYTSVDLTVKPGDGIEVLTFPSFFDIAIYTKSISDFGTPEDGVIKNLDPFYKAEDSRFYKKGLRLFYMQAIKEPYYHVHQFVFVSSYGQAIIIDL